MNNKMKPRRFPWYVFALFSALNGVLFALLKENIIRDEHLREIIAWPVLIPGGWILQQTGAFGFFGGGWIPMSMILYVSYLLIGLNVLSWGLISALVVRVISGAQGTQK